MTEKIIQQLLSSKEPAVQLKTYIQLLNYEYDSKEVLKITNTLKEKSTVVKKLLAFISTEEAEKYHVYTKWQGLHWNLSLLADIKYPPKDKTLYLKFEKEFSWLLSDYHWESKPIINGKRRFCASQEGNCLYAALSLGLEDNRLDILAERLIDYQWPDGGWNCDKKIETINSSYNESLIPTRSLNLYSKLKNNQIAKESVEKACELFLKRKLYKKQSDNSIINTNWLILYYPSYWHYDILSALKVLAECGKLNDSRTNDALTILESKQLPCGGFPIERKYYQTNDLNKRYFSSVDWGVVNKKEMNEWVTVDALFVLKEAKRLDLVW